MNTKINFAAMRRAIEPTNTRDLLHHPRFANLRQAAQTLSWGMKLLNQPEVECSSLCRHTISWRLQRKGWTSVRWVTLTEFAPGIIRLRNDLIGDIPKKVWSFARPRLREFELTFHWSEISDELGPKVFEFCNALGTEPFPYNWELFQGEATYPQYAWTQQAKRAYHRK